MQKVNGIVVAKPDAYTVIVQVKRKTPHPIYKKLLNRSKTYKVDTAGKDVAIGKQVRIVKVRPLSKTKFFRLEQS